MKVKDLKGPRGNVGCCVLAENGEKYHLWSFVEGSKLAPIAVKSVSVMGNLVVISHKPGALVKFTNYACQKKGDLYAVLKEKGATDDMEVVVSYKSGLYHTKIEKTCEPFSKNQAETYGLNKDNPPVGTGETIRATDVVNMS